MCNFEHYWTSSFWLQPVMWSPSTVLDRRCSLSLPCVSTWVHTCLANFEENFGSSQSRQCSPQCLSKIVVLKSTSQPDSPVSFPQIHALVHITHTDLIIGEDDQSTQICRSCHCFAHCQDDGHGLRPVVGLHPPVKDDADIEIRPLSETNITVITPTSSP